MKLPLHCPRRTSIMKRIHGARNTLRQHKPQNVRTLIHNIEEVDVGVFSTGQVKLEYGCTVLFNPLSHRRLYIRPYIWNHLEQEEDGRRNSLRNSCLSVHRCLWSTVVRHPGGIRSDVNQLTKSVLIKSNLEKCICSMLALLVRRSVQSGGPAISMASRGMAGNAAAGGSSGGNGDGAGGGGGGKKKARGKQDYKWKKKVCFPAMGKKKKKVQHSRGWFSTR